MTTDTPTTALVLGGGGSVGIAWQSGLLHGWRRAGFDPARAALILGTSAGSVVGARIAAGDDMGPHIVATLTEPGRRPTAAPATPDGPPPFVALMDAMAATAGMDPAEANRTLGAAALRADTAPADAVVTRFATLVGSAWPDRFACTAVDVDSGVQRIFTVESAVPLAAAVAASCAVPLLLPPVPVDGRRYMDGGLPDPLNAGMAVDHDVVVAVSCFPLTPPGSAAAGLAAVTEAGRRLVVVEPDADYLRISENGAAAMDTSRCAQAYASGVRLGERTVPAVDPA